MLFWVDINNKNRMTRSFMFYFVYISQHIVLYPWDIFKDFDMDDHGMCQKVYASLRWNEISLFWCSQTFYIYLYIVDISGCCPSSSQTIPVCDEGKRIFTRRYSIAGCPTVCVARFCVTGKHWWFHHCSFIYTRSRNIFHKLKLTFI